MVLVMEAGCSLGPYGVDSPVRETLIAGLTRALWDGRFAFADANPGAM